MPAILIVIVIALAPAALLWTSRAVRRSRRPRELGEDWWPEFERAFRDYESQAQGRSASPRRSSQ